ncbi:hypothetical protein [Nocardioides sp. Leaf285]|uniref:hypothetical protein n=1 Tax=Nocardioides sp. Leaf285 TaxID=1736322 RepID=UPI000702A540|nr:hypothetical protein [Nocardioides sp. Leaf285]KQP63037.1 hypothetical protein ASF47_18675 [Nocardioides sp. Leaf285]
MADTHPGTASVTRPGARQRPYLVTRAGGIVERSTGEEVGHVHRTDYGWDARLDVPETRSFMHATRVEACDAVWSRRGADPDQPDPDQPAPAEPGTDCWCGADGGEGCWCCTEDCPEDCTADHKGEQ